ncbi:hypothetical protein D3C81_2168280 [compost metagenome]
MRLCHIGCASIGVWLLVATSASDSSRSGWRSPMVCPIMPPTEIPQKCAWGICSASITATTSSASRVMV